MADERIILSELWVATMLVYLLGDVVRIFAGDFTPGEIDGEAGNQWMYLGIAALMLIPILMVVFSLTVPYPTIRWASVVVAALVGLFNLAGLPYDGWYDNFLIVVSLVFNGVVIWYAWTWQATVA